MKILFLSTWFPYPPDNGSKIRVYHLLRALAEVHQVTLVSFAFGTANPKAGQELQGMCASVHALHRDPFMRSRAAKALRFLSPIPIVSRPLPEMMQMVGKVSGSASFDVVIASTEVMALYALQGLPGTLAVLEVHNSMTRWMWDRHRQQESGFQRMRCWVTWQKIRAFEGRLFPRFGLCTMVSEQDAQVSRQLRPGLGERIAVVPNGVDCDRNRPGLADARPDTLVYNGSLTYDANYDAMSFFLSEVYPLIRRERPEARLTITGSHTGVDVDGLRLDSSVRLSGFVDDVRPWVAGASVAIAPIRQGGGTRLKILEAMALGTPVVATTKAAEGLGVVDGEHLLLADTAADFARCTVELLHNAGLRQRLSSNARRLVEERYDWKQIGARFAELVEGAAASAARKPVTKAPGRRDE